MMSSNPQGGVGQDGDTSLQKRRVLFILGLIVVVALAFVAFLVIRNRKAGTTGGTLYVETPQEKNDQLVLMNILNRFHLEQGRVSETASAKVKNETLKKNLQLMTSDLEATKSEGSAEEARLDLVVLMKRWQSYIDKGEDPKILRDNFIALGKKYTWLDTILWILLLNRL